MVTPTFIPESPSDSGLFESIQRRLSHSKISCERFSMFLCPIWKAEGELVEYRFLLVRRQTSWMESPSDIFHWNARTGAI